ncbi:MFS transporter [Specibacter sp. NPDC078692]|uniref:MFS transporter n=1 Tax=Specibacter sp. NPDC078692 TaxID=3155818 RepID=UPI00342C8B43
MTTTQMQASDAAMRKRVVRKVSGRLLPFLGLLYLINYLDRTNLAFAAPHGLNETLGLTATTFGMASGLFFIGYLLLEVPSNLALNKFGARRWIARIMVSWGIIATLMTFVPNVGTLYVMRFLLGVAEAGFFPGIILYMTFWFPKQQRAKALAVFILAVPLSAAIGSPLSSWLITAGDGVFGLDGWRFMFLMEGLPAVILGIMCWFYLTDKPAQAKWLKPDERAWLQQQIDSEEAETASRHSLSIKAALTKGRVWALAFVYFGITYGLYAINFFLPTIVAGFAEQFNTDFTVMQQGFIVAIPFVFGAFSMYFWAKHGDKTGERIWHVAAPTALGGIAIPVALYLNSPFAAMVAITICTMGICAALPTFWPLPSLFLTGAAAAAGIAFINSFGNFSGFIGPLVTGKLAEITGSQQAGMWVVGAVMVLASLVVVRLRTTLAPDLRAAANKDKLE